MPIITTRVYFYQTQRYFNEFVYGFALQPISSLSVPAPVLSESSSCNASHTGSVHLDTSSAISGGGGGISGGSSTSTNSSSVVPVPFVANESAIEQQQRNEEQHQQIVREVFIGAIGKGNCKLIAKYFI